MIETQETSLNRWLRLGLLALLACPRRWPRPRTGRILTYHAVDRDRSLVSTDPRLFRWQMERLRAWGYRGISLGEYLRWRQDRGRADPRQVALTFDDAMTSFHEEALPVLREAGFSATLFVISDLAGGSTSDWKWRGPDPGSTLMTWDQIADCVAQGVEIGSHTRTHPSLPRLDNEALRSEIRGSKEHIEQRVGCTVASFCYPYGEYDTRAVDVVRESGFAGAVTTRFGNDDFRGGALELPRLGMNRTSAPDWLSQKLYFTAALRGSLPYFQKVKQAVGLRRSRTA